MNCRSYKLKNSVKCMHIYIYRILVFNSIRWNFMKFCIYFVGMLKNNYINYLIEFEFRGMDFKLEVSN